MNRIEIPQSVLNVITQLNSNGYLAYLVGGCVRDMCIGTQPHDWDVTTSALPEEIMDIFPRTYPQGVKFGTVGVIEQDMIVEVTTFRTESDYLDFRHPSTVQFVTSLIDDLSRRDFTINALAMSRDGIIIDYFNGQEDIAKKVIRTVGTPSDRFYEDPLRMLRAIRFSAKLDFTIDNETFEGIRSCAHLCKHLSRERICSEIEKLLLSPCPSKLALFISSNIYIYLFPIIWVEGLIESDQISMQKILNLLNHFDNDFSIRLGILCSILNYITKSDCTSEFVNGLKSSNYIVNTAISISASFNENVTASRSEFARIIKLYGIQSLQLALKLQCLIYSLLGESRFSQSIDTLNILEYELLQGGLQLHELDITGQDLLVIGLRGKQIGNTLNRLHELVIANPLLNTNSQLITFAESMKINDEISNNEL